MPIIRQLLGRDERSKRMPSLSGRSTAAGISVTPEGALQVASVYSCVRLLSESSGMLPVHAFRGRGRTRERLGDDGHPAVRLVRHQPNPNMDAAELWRTVIGYMAIRGNAYVFVERNQAGVPVGLWPIAPTSVEHKRMRDGTITYEVKLQSPWEWAPIPADRHVAPGDMLHYRAFGLGPEGLSPIGLARQQVGISIAATQYIGGFFQRDASPGGVITVDGELSDDAFARLEQQWKDKHEGFDRSHRLAVLEGGAKWTNVSLSPDDAEFLSVMKFGRSEIAGIYGVPPHMIGDVERSTSWGTGIEHQGIGYVTYSLQPWLTRLERVTRRLFGSDYDMYFRWNVDGLLRGDSQSRHQVYTAGRQWGWLSANDVLELEDRDPIPGGDTYVTPLNMQPTPTSPAERTGRARPNSRNGWSAPPPAEQDVAWVTRHVDLLTETFAEQIDEVLAQERTLRRLDPSVWDAELADRLYRLAAGLAAEEGALAAAQFGGRWDADRADAWLRANAAAQARNINLTTADAITRRLADVDDGDAAGALAELLDTWRGDRVVGVAEGRVNQLGNWARTEGVTQAGGAYKTWTVTSQNPRDSHAAMSGETVGIDEPFSNGGWYPHDHRIGSPDEIAGCTCILTYS